MRETTSAAHPFRNAAITLLGQARDWFDMLAMVHGACSRQRAFAGRAFVTIGCLEITLHKRKSC